MSIWQTLGLEPTGDLDAIKQAYAERAKQYHPEEHPDEFRALHDAYRQAVRYARQHPAERPRPAPAAKPKTADFKPSFHVPCANDNPRRAHMYRCSDDEFNADQMHAICKENKRTSRPGPAPRFHPPGDAPLPHGKLPIRGAKRGSEPSGSLRFDAVEQSDDGDSDPAADLALPSQIPPDTPQPNAPTANAKPSYRMTVLLLLLWALYLFTFSVFAPGPLSLVLYTVWFVHLLRKGAVQRHWLLTIFAAFLDFFSMMLLGVSISPILPSALQEASNVLFTLAAFALVIFRFAIRISQQTHK